MRIVFIGTVQSSNVAIQALLRLGSNIVGVITASNSDFNSDYADITPLCKEHKIPYLRSRGAMGDEEKNFLKTLDANVAFCVGWSFLIKEDILSMFKKGVIGFHPAPLPVGRGRHPIIWSLALGLTETNSCFFIMDAGADSGDIVSIRTIKICPDDTALTLMQKILGHLDEQILEIITGLKSGNLKRMPQDNTRATYWRKRSMSDGRIDFRMPGTAICNLVRALTPPYPGAHIEHCGRIFSVHASSFQPAEGIVEPGKVIDICGTTLRVRCNDGILEFEQKELAGILRPGEYFL